MHFFRGINISPHRPSQHSRPTALTGGFRSCTLRMKTHPSICLKNIERTRISYLNKHAPDSDCGRPCYSQLSDSTREAVYQNQNAEELQHRQQSLVLPLWVWNRVYKRAFLSGAGSTFRPFPLWRRRLCFLSSARSSLSPGDWNERRGDWGTSMCVLVRVRGWDVDEYGC